MSSPKEKAKELFDMLFHAIPDDEMGEDYPAAKNCAIIVIREIQKCTKHEKQQFENDRFSENYWEEVRQEIEQL